MSSRKRQQMRKGINERIGNEAVDTLRMISSSRTSRLCLGYDQVSDEFER